MAENTCHYCGVVRVVGDNHYAICPVIARIFGPPRRMCRRCANDAEPHRMLCQECQVKYGRTAPARLHDRQADLPETLSRVPGDDGARK